MTESFYSFQPLPDFPLWQQTAQQRVPFSFDFELTARCNNDCSHCYINLPAGDRAARAAELSLAEIDHIASQAVELGALWVLLTGGEPLLRRDFADIYLLLKRKGLLVSVFTNACLVTPAHVRLFQRYPPRDLEVTVYGATKQTYDRVTRKPGSYAAFRRGLELLIAAGVPVRLKAMALRSNLHEMDAIADFCRHYTKDYFRFDPLLHLRYDRDPGRNAEIRAERLTSAEIVALEQSDPERSASLQQHCTTMPSSPEQSPPSNQLFRCGAGLDSFSITYNGFFRLCSSLTHPTFMWDLKQVDLRQAWFDCVPQVRGMRSANPEFARTCGACSLVDLCLWCPANAALEFGLPDAHGEYFCQVANARVAAIQENSPDSIP